MSAADRELTKPILIRPSSIALWTGILAGPIAWGLDLELRYMLVDYACAKQAHWLLPLIGVVLFLVAIFGATQARRGWNPDESTQPNRVRFMSVAGLTLSIFSAIAILASEIPNIFLRACD